MRTPFLIFCLALSMSINAQVKEGTYDLSLGEQYGFMMGP